MGLHGDTEGYSDGVVAVVKMAAVPEEEDDEEVIRTEEEEFHSSHAIIPSFTICKIQRAKRDAQVP